MECHDFLNSASANVLERNSCGCLSVFTWMRDKHFWVICFRCWHCFKWSILFSLCCPSQQKNWLWPFSKHKDKERHLVTNFNRLNIPIGLSRIMPTVHKLKILLNFIWHLRNYPNLNSHILHIIFLIIFSSLKTMSNQNFNNLLTMSNRNFIPKMLYHRYFF